MNEVETKAVPEIGVSATVVCDSESSEPCQLDSTYEDGARAGLRDVFVFDTDDIYTADDDRDDVDLNKCQEVQVQEISIVSTYFAHVALYALQNPSPENIQKALRKLACSGDLEEHWAEGEDDLPTPATVPEPPQWERDF